MELEFCQLVFQFRLIRAFGHLQGRRKGQLKLEVVKSLRVKDVMVGQDLVVVQCILRVDIHGFLVTCT